MDLLKALKRTTILSAAVSAVAVLALGATQAQADSTVGGDVLGHISAIVVGPLTVAENQAINFGNFGVICAIPAACVADAASILLTDQGTRTITGTDITLINTGAAGGVLDGTNHETGSQSPGFYTIVSGMGGTESVYVSFADTAGNIIDDGFVNHPNNRATITGPGIARTSTVDKFSFETDSQAAAGPGSGYTMQHV